MRDGWIRSWVSIPVLAVVLLVAGQAWAQDPPARVGRLSLVEGAVSFYDRDAGQWVAATPNYPVTSGQSYWTEPGARAEIRIGADAIRLDGGTQLDLVRLDDEAIQLQLPRGSLAITLAPRAPDGGVSLLRPETRVELQRPGRYRVDGGPEEDRTRVVSFDGEATIFPTSLPRLPVVRGTGGVLSGTTHAGFHLTDARPDAFDQWAWARDEAAQPRHSAQYVPPAMTGYEDLDRHGSWSEEPDYGPVWYPTAVAPGWVPYRYGHWAWVEPWGWTWIDDAPWGFAPFHYGRWAHFRGRWGWVPGRARHAPVVYAPALVTFVGFGSHWRPDRHRPPAIGWCPLGPREVYRPHYKSSVTYVRNVNVGHVERPESIRTARPTKQDNDFSRYRNAGAATVVDRDAFVGRRPVSKASVDVPQRAWDGARMNVATPPRPERPQSRAGEGWNVVPRPGAAAAPPGPATVPAMPRPPAAQQDGSPAKQSPRSPSMDASRGIVLPPSAPRAPPPVMGAAPVPPVPPRPPAVQQDGAPAKQSPRSPSMDANRGIAPPPSASPSPRREAPREEARPQPPAIQRPIQPAVQPPPRVSPQSPWGATPQREQPPAPRVQPPPVAQPPRPPSPPPQVERRPTPQVVQPPRPPSPPPRVEAPRPPQVERRPAPQVSQPPRPSSPPPRAEPPRQQPQKSSGKGSDYQRPNQGR